MTDNVQAAPSPHFGFDRNSLLARFWRWWSGELAALLPQWLGRAGENAASSQLIEISPQFIVLYRRQQGILTEQGRLELQSGNADANGIALQALFSRVHRNSKNVALLLSGTQYLVRRVELPLAALENLRQVLGFEMDRHTPFKADQVYFGFRTLHQDTARKRIAVNLIIAPREAVDGSVELLARLGIPVRAIYVSDPENGDDGNINLMPNSRRATEPSGLGKLNLTLFLLTLVLALAAILIPVWQKRQASIALIPLVDRAKQQAMATEALRQKQEKLAAEFNLMLNKKQEVPPVIVVLDELSALLPDDTWVQQFNLKGKELQIQGETASSSRLITLIESSRIFHNSSFRSPLTKGSTPNSERYQLVAEVKPLTVAALKSWPLFLASKSETTSPAINDVPSPAVEPVAASAVRSSTAPAYNPSAAITGRPQRQGNDRGRRAAAAQSTTPQAANAVIAAPVEAPARSPAGETVPNAAAP